MRSTANHICIAQLSLAGLAWVAALSLLPTSFPSPAEAAEPPIRVAGGGIVVYGPAYVLENYIHREQGKFVFTDPEGREWPLIDDPASPLIANHGDGAFHPFDPGVVADAIETISYPMQKVEIEVFLLPFPREEVLECSAGDGTIYLSPGVYEIPDVYAHAVVAHEAGHCVQRKFMPPSDVDSWREYREIRGISDRSVYNSAAAHRNRPAEIFAEDFRWLFGGEKSRAGGGIENGDLEPPDDVAGLREFFLSLSEARLAKAARPVSWIQLSVSSCPNPFTGSTTITIQARTASGTEAALPAGDLVSAVIFDAAGRAVKHVGPITVSGTACPTFDWDGEDDSGRGLPSGIYFLRAELAGRGLVSTGKVMLRR